MSLTRKQFNLYHSEVVTALQAIGNPAFGQAVQADRGSQIEHLGIRFPNLRRRVREGFSFYALSELQVLEVWDALWQKSPYGDVLFAALEFYAPKVRKRVSPNLWPVVRHWSERVDNWCHSDNLSSLYSRILENRFNEVYPQLLRWNNSDNEWQRRISLVSLIHYSGKNAVFLPPEKVLPLISNCWACDGYYVQIAMGWVLREMGQVYAAEITEYLETNGPQMSALVFSQAISRRSAEERSRLKRGREARKATRH